MQDCPIFNDGSFDALRKEGAEERLINVRHGEPITFGADGEFCVVKSGFGLEVAKTADVAADEIVVHDAQIDDPAYAFALSRLSEQNLEHTVMGIFRQVSRPTYDEMARDQVASARDSKPHDTAALQSLLRGKDTWTVDSSTYPSSAGRGRAGRRGFPAHGPGQGHPAISRARPGRAHRPIVRARCSPVSSSLRPASRCRRWTPRCCATRFAASGRCWRRAGSAGGRRCRS